MPKCPICGKPTDGSRKWNVCSKPCYVKRYNRETANKKLLASGRINAKCATCGKQIPRELLYQSSRRYCSDECQRLAVRIRQRKYDQKLSMDRAAARDAKGLFHPTPPPPMSDPWANGSIARAAREPWECWTLDPAI